MTVQYKPLGRGVAKGLAIVAATLAAAIVAHAGASAAGLPALFFEGLAGGAVLTVGLWSLRINNTATPELVDSTPDKRITFTEPQTAMVTCPPYEAKEYDVFAIEAAPDGEYGFKVWATDESGKEQYPFYASSVEFDEMRLVATDE